QPPVVVDGSLGVVSQTGDVIFLSPAGRLQSRARMYRGSDTRPVAGDRYMYVASLDQRIYAMSPFGGIQWEKLTSYPLVLQPTYHDGVLYCGTRDQGLLALDGATGATLWNSPGVHGEVIAERDGWLMVWDGSHVTTLDPETGDIVEHVELPGISSIAFDDFVDGNMYVVSTSGLVAKFIPRS
ncbi:MAG: PQQ-binding-like beta-propeller repeat protein, partial [Phycisphaerales bacterium]|nr:PQQ-binding-like beta-propeller repeat protein [Phycisphaerales bacterium]